MFFKFAVCCPFTLFGSTSEVCVYNNLIECLYDVQKLGGKGGSSAVFVVFAIMDKFEM